MPFKGVDVMDVKKEFVLRSPGDRGVFTELPMSLYISVTNVIGSYQQNFAKNMLSDT